MALLATLVDNFNDNSQNTGLWNVGKIPGDAASCTGVTVAETAAQLQVTPRSSTAGVYYCGYVSVATYDMTASGAYARFVQNTSSSVGVESVFKIGSGILDKYSYSFYTAGTSLYARARVNGTNTDVASATYSSTNHAWLKITESGGTIYWYTAPDNAGVPGTWTQFATRAVDSGFDKTAVYFHLGAGTWQSVASPGMAKWDSVNGGANTLTRTVTATAALSAVGVKRTVGASAALRATLLRAATATAILATRSSRTAPASAVLAMSGLKRIVPASAALQATLKRSAPASAALKATRARSIAASVALLSHNTRAVPGTAVLALTGARFSRPVSASAILATRSARSLAATALLSATLKRTLTSSASLKSVFTRSLPSSAALVGRSSRAVGSSAYLSPAAVIGSPHAQGGGEGALPGGGMSGAGSKSGVRTPLVRVGARRV